jgi:uncharacterized protein DUF4338
MLAAHRVMWSANLGWVCAIVPSMITAEPEDPDPTCESQEPSVSGACGDSIRAAWIASGLRYAAFAARCGITPEELARYEEGAAQPSWKLWRTIIALGEHDARSLVAVAGPADGTSKEQLAKGESSPLTDEALALRAMVLDHLRKQGFELSGDTILAPVQDEKDHLRRLNSVAVRGLRETARGALQRREQEFIRRLARGSDFDPARVRPRLKPVEGHRNEDALLWRWCALHWSIPLSRGYGRRLRFLITDAGHDDAVIGIIGLADPVYALRARDQWIGWDREQRAARLHNVMEAFVLGAVPPYTTLCGGKLAALLTTSNEVRDAFRQRYGHRQTLIGQRDPDAQLAMVTTHSALGRSSVYNRLRHADGKLAFRSVGFTVGSGDFHLTGEVYERLASFARKNMNGPSGRHERWSGDGFRNRREVLQRALSALELDDRRLRHHGIKRELFVAPLAENTAAWLRGEVSTLHWRGHDVDDLAGWWRQRWALPRATRQDSWRTFEPTTWALYNQ